MSITSSTTRLFRKAVKVLKGGRRAKPQRGRAEACMGNGDVAGCLLEPLESRLLLSTVTISTIAQATEGTGDGIIRITRDDDVGDLTVKFKASPGPNPNKDFTLNDGLLDLTRTVVIPDGATFVDINMVPVDDALAEPTETVTFKLLNSRDYDLDSDVTTRTTTATITDNEPTVTIEAVDSLAAEATPATETGMFTITRTGSTVGDLEVKLKINGKAKFNKDYIATSGGLPINKRSIIIPDGSATVDILIEPIDDTAFEATENVNITVKNAKTYTPGTLDTASVIIEDNEPFVFVDPTASAPGTFTITTDTNFGADSFITTGPEAEETHDAGPTFVEWARDGGLLINQDIPLRVRNVEGSLTGLHQKAYISFDMSLFPFTNFSNAILTLTLVEVTGVSPNNTNWTFNVYGLDDDFVPDATEQGEDWDEDINYLDAPANVANGGMVDLDDVFGGAPLGSFDIVGTGTLGQKLSISGQLLTDYLNNETTLDMDGDNLVTFIIVRENVGNLATDTVTHAFGSRDDPFGEADSSVIPALTGFGPVVGRNVDEGVGSTVRIFRAGSTTGDVTVNFRVKGTAKLGQDYTLTVGGVPVSNSLVIPDGEDFVDLTVSTIADDVFEIGETIEILFKPGSGYVLSNDNRTANITIVDTNPVVTVVATDFVAQEPDVITSSLNTGTFTLERSGSTASELTVQVRFTGTAFNGRDFALIDEEVTFLPGEDTIDLEIEPLADRLPEGIETVTLTVLPGDNYGVNWVVTGTNIVSGSEVGPIVIAANSLSQAREVAKARRIGAPSILGFEQSDFIEIEDGIQPNGPDLIIERFNITLDTVDNDTIGGALGTVRIHNQGNQSTGPFNVTFFLSSDRTLGGGDVTLGTQFIQNLGDFSSVEVAMIFNDITGVAAGEYFIYATADVDGFVLESIENNNTRFSTNPEVTVID